MKDWKGIAEDMIVVILGGGRGARLDPLTRMRAKPAVPIAGKYRLIDIPISNAIHSGMERMFLLTQYNSISLHRHISRTYKFDHFSRGFVQILAAQQTPEEDQWYQGTADAVRKNLRIILGRRGDLVLILAGDHLYRMDYREMVREHLAADADLTVAVLPCREEEIHQFGAVRIDGAGRVVEFREKPGDAAARAGMQVPGDALEARGVSGDRGYLASMGVYLFRKSFLDEALRNTDRTDFGHHILPAAVGTHHVQSHFFTGYWRDIGTIRAFYEAHMDMVRPVPPFDFYDPEWPFLTHPRYLPGSLLRGCRFHQAILADGCVIEDSMVEESVVGVRSRMTSAKVRRSLVMGAEEYPPPRPGAPPIGIGEGSLIENAIIDLNARIGRNVRIVNREGVRDAEGDGWVVRGGIVVVAKDTVIPDGTVI